MPQLAFGSRPSGKRLSALPQARETLDAIGAAERTKGVREMITDEIRQVVKTRYGKFAETGGHKEPG
jgi:hypothetical protein